jgi:hypothetical protein
MQDLFEAFVSSTKGTFLAKDRDSNFPSENTVPDAYEDLCRQLVATWDETVQMPISHAQRRKVLCAKVEWIVSAARARLSGC